MLNTITWEIFSPVEWGTCLSIILCWNFTSAGLAEIFFMLLILTVSYQSFDHGGEILAKCTDSSVQAEIPHEMGPLNWQQDMSGEAAISVFYFNVILSMPDFTIYTSRVDISKLSGLMFALIWLKL